MVNNWFFSSNGEVIGPLALKSAKLYVVENPNMYGWHPTLVHWQPVSCIDEFSRLLPPPVQGSIIPKEISDQFITKQKRLENRLTTMESGIKNTEYSIENLHEKISQYKLLTQNLSLDVKDSVNNIENKYTHLKQQLLQTQKAVNIAHNEMLTVVDDFNRRVHFNDVCMPSSKHHASQNKIESQKSTLNNRAEKPKLAEETLSAVYQPIEGVPLEEQEARHLESIHDASDYLKLYKKINSQKSTKPQQFYRGTPIDAPDKVEGIKKKPMRQVMYRGSPILVD